MKGVSIPINTLVMLAVAIIVLLAAVAWFMGAFSPAAKNENYMQTFNNACMSWVNSNCDLSYLASDTSTICTAYKNYINDPGFSCTAHKEQVAAACGCTPPYGTGV